MYGAQRVGISMKSTLPYLFSLSFEVLEHACMYAGGEEWLECAAQRATGGWQHRVDAAGGLGARGRGGGWRAAVQRWGLPAGPLPPPLIYVPQLRLHLSNAGPV